MQITCALCMLGTWCHPAWMAGKRPEEVDTGVRPSRESMAGTRSGGKTMTPTEHTVPLVLSSVENQRECGI